MQRVTVSQQSEVVKSQLLTQLSKPVFRCGVCTLRHPHCHIKGKIIFDMKKLINETVSPLGETTEKLSCLEKRRDRGRNCNRLIRQDRQKAFDRKAERFELQDEENDLFIDRGCSQDLSVFMDMMSRMKESVAHMGVSDETWSIVESIILFIWDIRNVTSWGTLLTSVLHLIKHLIRGSLVSSCFNFAKTILCEFNIQDGEMFFGEATFKKVEDIFNGKGWLEKSAFWVHIKKFLIYLFAAASDILPVKSDPKLFRNFYAEVEKHSTDHELGILYHLTESFTFIVNRMYSYAHSGRVESLFIKEDSYILWQERFAAAKLDYAAIGSPDASIRTDVQIVLGTYNKLCDDANSIEQVLSSDDKWFIGVAKRNFNEARLTRFNLLNRIACLGMREAPFPVLISSQPSCGKTTLVTLIESYFGQLKGLRVDESIRYTRNLKEEYWSNFNSSQWSILFDDLAYEHPNSLTMNKSSVSEIIQVMNNVAYVANMAELELKGNNAVIPKLVVGTTNTAHLNAQFAYACPYAVNRRFPYVIDIVVKPEFATPERGLDSSKLPEDMDIPDYWLITIKKFIPIVSNGSKIVNSREQVVEQFTNIYDFLRWLKQCIHDHDETQKKILAKSRELQCIKYCFTCHHSAMKCVCFDADLVSSNSEGIEECCPVCLCSESPCDCDMTPGERAFNEIQDGDIRHYLHSLFSNSPRTPQAQMYANSWKEGCVDFFMLYFKSMWDGKWPVLSTLLLNYFWPCIITRTLCIFLFTSFIFNAVSASVYFGAFIFSSLLPRLPHSIRIRIFIFLARRWYRPGVVKDFTVFTGAVTVFSFIATVYLARKIFAPSRPPPAPELVKDVDEYDVQGAAPSANIWVKQEPTIALDYGRSVVSWKAMPEQEIAQRIGCNVVRILCHYSDRTKQGMGIFVKGRILMTNFHLFPNGTSFTIIREQDKNFCHPLKVTIPTENQLHFQTEDISFYMVQSSRMFRDISDLFPLDLIPDLGCSAIMLKRGESGLLEVNRSRTIFYNGIITFTYKEYVYNSTTYAAKFSNTIKGDCGSPYVAMTSVGPCIVALHQSLNNFSDQPDTRGVAVSQKIIDRAIKHFSLEVQGNQLMDAATCHRLNLLPLHERSIIREFAHLNCEIFGSIKCRMPSKSKVEKSLVHQLCLDRGWEDAFGPPVMAGREVWRNVVSDMMHQNVMMDSRLLTLAKNMYFDEVISKLNERQLSAVQVLPLEACVLGEDGVDHVDHIPYNTSAGFPHCRSKRYYLNGETNTLDENIMAEYIYIQEQYRQGRRAMPIFNCHLKDEVRKKSKIISNNTRCFTGSNFAFSLVVRKYFLTICKLICENQELFESYPGTNCFGEDWTSLYDYITSFGKSRMFAGDFRAFDKTMSIEILEAAWDLLIAICKRASYSDGDIEMLNYLKWDLIMPCVNVNGDLLMVYGMNPSGHPLTTIINCIVNCLYMRMAFIRGRPGKESFKDYVHLATYGDDNIGGVSMECNWFDHSVIAECMNTIGIEYTMADKTSISVPFVHIDECTFLQRTFVYHMDLNRIGCPLSDTSLHKMLMYGLPSASVDAHHLIVINLDTYLGEMVWYGREKYGSERVWIMQALKSLDLMDCVRPSMFPFYDEAINKLRPIEIQGNTILKTCYGSTCDECGSEECIIPNRKESILCPRCMTCRHSDLELSSINECLYCSLFEQERCDICSNSVSELSVLQITRYWDVRLCEACFYSSNCTPVLNCWAREPDKFLKITHHHLLEEGFLEELLEERIRLDAVDSESSFVLKSIKSRCGVIAQQESNLPHFCDPPDRLASMFGRLEVSTTIAQRSLDRGIDPG